MSELNQPVVKRVYLTEVYIPCSYELWRKTASSFYQQEKVFAT